MELLISTETDGYGFRKEKAMITVKARKDDVNYEIVYYINLVKVVNGVDYILHIGRKTEMGYYELLSMLDFLNVEYEVDEGWMED